MVVEIKKQVCDGHMLRWLTAAGLGWLENNVERVNRMNVFPVPDGDTGTNMLLTMQKAYQEIAQTDDGHVGIVSDNIARGALMGARGNSGVILSQLLRGFAAALKGHEVFDSHLFARACETAVDAAYGAVMEPVEGTILTVARVAKEAVLEKAAADAPLRETLEAMVEAAREGLKQTPDLLPVLKEAGVVDSGGMGLLYILEGMQRMLEGQQVDYGQATNGLATNGQHWQEALVPEDEEGYGYDVQFLMRGANLDVNAIRTDIDSMGWSTLVVGDSSLVKVHVHVHNPGEPLSYAIRLGANLDDIVVENMQLQYQTYVDNRVARESANHKQVDGIAVITVVPGDGLAALFENDLNAARVIAGGQTMNPSTEDFLAAIDSLPNDEIVLLPNNKNIIMAAEQAASLSRSKNVRVIPSRTIPQGIASMLAYRSISGESLDTVASAMEESLREIVSIEITTAIRDTTVDEVTVKQGQIIGLLNGKLVAAGDEMTDVLLAVMHKAHAEDRELVTIYYGDEVGGRDAQMLVDAISGPFGNLTFEVIRGGQPLYPYIISIE